MRRLALAPVLVAAAVLSASAGEAPRPGGLLALARQDVAGPNLLANGGFEERAGSAPAGWTLHGEGDVWSLDASAHGGAASLRLAGSATARLVAGAEQTVTLGAGSYTLEGWIKASALGAGAKGSGVRLCLDARPRLQWWKCTPLVTGTQEWAVTRAPMLSVTDPGTYRVTVGAYGVPDGAAYFDDVSLARVGRPPLDVYVLYPNFRGMLFDDRSQVIRVALTVGAPRREAPRGGVAGDSLVRLSLVDESSGTVRLRRDVSAVAGDATTELDASGLPTGAALLRAELVRAGEVVYRAPDHRVVKVPAKARESFTAWYDERNVLHLRGKPAFVIGLYTTGGYSDSAAFYARGQDGWGTAKMAEAPVNMLINYWLGLAPVPALEALMDDLASRGIAYLHTVNFYDADDPQYARIPHPAARQGADALNRWIARALSGHRGFAGFYTADERPAEAVPRVFRQHRALAEGAPGSLDLVVLGDGWESQAPLWRDAADVLGLDPYPITKPPGDNDLAMVGDWTRLGRDAVRGSRPVWTVVQWFPLTTAGGWPREQDLRAMSWMAIVDGAQGLFYWSFGAKGLAWVKDPALREQRWCELVRVTREIRAYEPVLLAPDAPVVGAESSGGAIRLLGKRGPDGDRYVFAYNRRNAPATVTWTLTAPAREATDLAASRALPLTDDGTRLGLEFAPYEVKQIRLR